MRHSIETDIQKIRCDINIAVAVVTVLTIGKFVRVNKNTRSGNGKDDGIDSSSDRSRQVTSGQQVSRQELADEFPLKHLK
jgi:hypothetical protein